MSRFTRTALMALIVSVGFAAHASAQQSVTLSLLERYLDSLRQQSGIPGMSAAVVQNGRVIWEKGFGVSDVERAIAARPDTPYPIGDLTQALSSALLLEQCAETGHLDLDDRIREWMPSFSESNATVRDVLAHRAPGGSFKFDTGRYASLTGVIESCIRSNPTPFREALSQNVFERLGMSDSVPALNVDDGSADDRSQFSDGQLSRFGSVLRRMALAYRTNNGNATLNTSVARSVDAATGAISTVRDLARFDSAIDDSILLHRDTMSEMWSNVTGVTGLGWFVQNYNGQRLYWQFGRTQGAYSSLLLKVPDKHLTLILLANSDGLSAFPLQDGDVSTSLFARAFLKLFVG